MKATAEKITNVYGLLAQVKYSKLDSKDKINLIKISNKFKDIADKLNGLRQENYKILTQDIPEFTAIGMKVQAGQSLTPSESMIFQKIDKELGESLKEEREREYEFDFEPWKDSVMEKLLDSNDFNVAQTLAIYEIIGK